MGWGDRTVDEMGHAWINITYYNDEEFKAEASPSARGSREGDDRRDVGASGR